MNLPLNPSDSTKISNVKAVTLEDVKRPHLFWKYVLPLSKEQCWNWKGSIFTTGYGICRAYDSHTLTGAHRISWILHNGGIPAGLSVLHHCDNRKCVNPYHLFLGTQKDNMADAKMKHRFPRQDGDFNNGRKINSMIAKIIRELHGEGVTAKVIANKFGVSQSLVRMIVKQKIWKCL